VSCTHAGTLLSRADEGDCGRTPLQSKLRRNLATLLQDANVDPLIRQQTLGHRPASGAGLGMTASYTHTRPETQREQIERALRRWPESLRIATERISGDGGGR